MDRVRSTESELLARINEGLPDVLRGRYGELIARRDQALLDSDEHAELLRLSAEVEQHEGDRVAALAELARMRGVSLSAVMNLPGISAPSDG
jgi:hypothetical protein